MTFLWRYSHVFLKFNRGVRGRVFTLVQYYVHCSLATVMSCIDPSVRIVTKSPKHGPLLLLSISLGATYLLYLCGSVADPDPNPDPDPPDPHVLGLPDPDALVRGMDPDPSIIMQK